MNDSSTSYHRTWTRPRIIVSLLLLVALVGSYLLQTTPPLEISNPTLLRILPAPETDVAYVAVAHIGRLRRLAGQAPWSHVLDENLIQHWLARGVFPDGVAHLNEREMSRALGLARGEAGVLTRAGGKLAVVEVGLSGRIAFNLTRWLAPLTGRALRSRYGATRGVSLLSTGSEKPRVHAAMRGSYLFASPDEEFLTASLAIAEGSNQGESVADRLSPLPIDERMSDFTFIQIGHHLSPRLLTAEIDPKGADVCYRYVPLEELSTLPPEALLEPAGSIPKSAGVYLSSVWPPALLAGLSATTKTLRDEAEDWLSGRAPRAVETLEREVASPVTFAAAAWVEVPGYLPFPEMVIVASGKDGGRAFEALDETLRTTLHPGFTRHEIRESETGRVSFKNEGYLGALAPSMTFTGDQVLVASTERFLGESLGALEGRGPSLEDRAEIAGLPRFAGSTPLAAVFFASGRDLGKLGSDLLLKLASDLPSTAADDARDLLVPAIEKLGQFHHIFGRLEVENRAGTARFDFRFELNELQGNER